MWKATLEGFPPKMSAGTIETNFGPRAAVVVPAEYSSSNGETIMGGTLLAFTTVLAVYAAPPAEGRLPLHPIETHIIERTNSERVLRGLRPLRIDRRLMRSARRHAGWMTRSRSLRHTSEPVGENIAMGQRNTPEVVRDWMNSPGHRANILNGQYTRIGVAAYRTPEGTIYWCQQFRW